MTIKLLEHKTGVLVKDKTKYFYAQIEKSSKRQYSRVLSNNKINYKDQTVMNYFLE